MMATAAQNVAFWAIFVVIVGAALCSVLLRNVVHCALALALCFLGVAGYYALLQAEFLAGVQVLIYVGAITVLMIFAVMLTQQPSGPGARATNRQSWLAACVACTVLGLLAINLLGLHAGPARPGRPARAGTSPFSEVSTEGPADLARAGLIAGVGATAAEQYATRPRTTTALIGQRFIGEYIWPFEVVSIILLAALVGSIYIARDSTGKNVTDKSVSHTETDKSVRPTGGQS